MACLVTAGTPLANREKTVGHHLLSRGPLSTIWAPGRTLHWLPWFNVQKSLRCGQDDTKCQPLESSGKINARRTVWCSRPAWEDILGSRPVSQTWEEPVNNNNNKKNQCALRITRPQSLIPVSSQKEWCEESLLREGLNVPFPFLGMSGSVMNGQH